MTWGRAIVVALRLIVLSLATGSAQAQTVPEPGPAPPETRGHGGPIRALAVLDGDTIVTGGFDSAILVWDIASGVVKRALRFHDSAVNALTALPGQCFASGGEDARIAVWCGSAEAPVRILEGHRGAIAALSGNLASAAWDRQVRSWSTDGADPADDRTSTVVFEHDAVVTGVGWLADGRRIVSASYDGEVRLTGLDPSVRPLRRVRFAVALNALAVGAAGRIAIAGADGRLRVLDAELEVVGDIEVADRPLSTLAVSPDGRVAAVAGLGTAVTLVDLGARRILRTLEPASGPVWSLAFSTHGAVLFAGGGDGVLRRWTVATGAALGDAAGQNSVPTVAAASTEPGARVFGACRVCHAVSPDDGPRAGPTLHGVMGRRVGTVPGYAYSKALAGSNIVWSPEAIARLFEIGPEAMLPGTKMPEQRITDPADRTALVDWLARVTKP